MSEALRYARRRPREAVLSMPRESFQQLPPERRERLLRGALRREQRAVRLVRVRVRVMG